MDLFGLPVQNNFLSLEKTSRTSFNRNHLDSRPEARLALSAAPRERAGGNARFYTKTNSHIVESLCQRTTCREGGCPAAPWVSGHYRFLYPRRATRGCRWSMVHLGGGAGSARCLKNTSYVSYQPTVLSLFPTSYQRKDAGREEMRKRVIGDRRRPSCQSLELPWWQDVSFFYLFAGFFAFTLSVC